MHKVHAFSIDKPVMYNATHARNSTALPAQRRRVDNSMVRTSAGRSAVREGHSRKQISFTNSRKTKQGFPPFEESSEATKFGFNPPPSRTLQVQKHSKNGIKVSTVGQRSILRSVKNSDDGASIEVTMNNDDFHVHQSDTQR